MRTRNRPEDDKSSGSSVTDGDADLWNQKCVRLNESCIYAAYISPSVHMDSTQD